jgi:hypothetical protein
MTVASRSATNWDAGLIAAQVLDEERGKSVVDKPCVGRLSHPP